MFHTLFMACDDSGDMNKKLPSIMSPLVSYAIYWYTD